MLPKIQGLDLEIYCQTSHSKQNNAITLLPDEQLTTTTTTKENTTMLFHLTHIGSNVRNVPATDIKLTKNCLSFFFLEFVSTIISSIIVLSCLEIVCSYTLVHTTNILSKCTVFTNLFSWNSYLGPKNLEMVLANVKKKF